MKIISFISEEENLDIFHSGAIAKHIDQNPIFCSEILEFLQENTTVVITNFKGIRLLAKYFENVQLNYQIILGKLCLTGHLYSIHEIENISSEIPEHIILIPDLPVLNDLVIGAETITEELKNNISKILKNQNVQFTNIKTAMHVYSMFQLISICKSSVWSVLESIGYREDIDFNLLDRIQDSYYSILTSSASKLTCDTNYLYIRSLIEYLRDNSLPTHFTEGVLRNLNFFWRLKNKVNKTNKTNLIEFYNVDEPFGFLSNFSEHPIFMNGVIWPTVEHYYQGQKFTDRKYQECIRMATSPASAKEISHKMKQHHRTDWQQLKVEIMRQALKAKFSQHPDLIPELVGTGKLMLIEHAENDEFWGDGKKGTGVNKLGLLLMEIRELLNPRIE